MSAALKEFRVSESYDVPIETGKNGRMIARNLASFWSKVGDVKNSCGVYVFCIRAAKGYVPWYVGKAAKQPFQKEVFSDNKLA